MYSRVNYTIVGIFVILFGAGLIWFAFWLGKYETRQSYYTYKLNMTESVSGLSVDSDVMFRGVDIGRVSDIRINPENIEQIEVYLKIPQDIPIKEDMVASTKMFGVTGLLSVEIEGGSNSAKTLEPTDDYIPVIKTKPSLITTLSHSAESITQRLNNVIIQAEKLLSDENLENVEKILVNVEELTHNSHVVRERALKSLEELDLTLQESRASMATLTGDVDSVKKVLVPTIENFNRVILQVEKDLASGDYDLKKILEPLIIDVQLMTSEVSEMAREVEQSPSDIFFKSRKQLRGPGE